MRRFEEFLNEGTVSRVSKDIGLAKSLKEFSENHFDSALKLPLEEKYSTIVHELVYNALRELIDSLLALGGYKSRSHAASISYLQKFQEISPAEIAKLDKARENRNLASYYAKPVDFSDTKSIIELHNKLKPRLLNIYDRLGGR